MNRAPEFAEERRARILDMVNAQGRVKVTELADELQVTEPTVRKDITVLDQQRKLRRTHGGALAVGNPSYEIQIDTRRDSNPEGKRRIAQTALALISPNDSIFLDAGTTTLAIADALVVEAAGPNPRFGRNLNVLTNSIPVAKALASVGTIHHSLLGGQYRPIADSLVGPLALQAARQFAVNLAFIGVTGLAAGHLSVADLGEADLKRAIILQAHRTVVAMDATKLGLSDFVTLCDLGDIDTLITDAENDFLAAQSAASNTELIVAEA